MPEPIRLLIVEDSPLDEELVVLELRRSGHVLSHRRVETADELRAALSQQPWDAVISDYMLPGLNALDAIRIVLESEDGADLPFLIVSGSIGEETAVAALKAGAHDFFLKDNLTLLGSALERELREAAVRRERRSALDRLRKSEEQLRQAVKARDEFLSIASHELKTPLTPLRLHVESALAAVRRSRAAPLEDAAAWAGKLEAKLGMAARSVERLGVLIETLLDVTRITGGRFTVSRTEMNLADVVRDGVERWRSPFEASGTPLSFETDGALVGHWDRAAMDTVLNNLLSNALKFGEKKPVVVALRRDGETARLVVEDHGFGIEPEDQIRIFQRFERAVSSAHFGGLGIGLWVVREVTEAFGGSIQVASRKGAGSTFTVTLPVDPPGGSSRSG